MKDKFTYDKNRHFDIVVNGKKTKILKYLIKNLPSGEKQIVFKTKIRGGALAECGFHTPHTFEIPTEEGTLTVTGIWASALFSPEMCDYGFKIID